MKILNKALNILWDQLKNAPAEYAVEYKAKSTGIFSNNDKEILIAIDNLDNNRHLIIPIKEGHYQDDTSSRGINILYRTFKKEEIDFQFIDVVCTIPRLNELLNIIIAEILDEVKVDNSDPYKICIKILQQWRELISRQYSRLLPEHEIRGLFGELWYLRELLDYDSDVLKYWQGPQGQPHDFSNGTIAFEVKTHVRKERIIIINGIEQLTPPIDGTLYLCVLKLKKVTGGGESIPDIIESLRDKGVSYTELLTKLADIGYSINDSEQYKKKFRYQISENKVYLVDNDFPKITIESFKNNQIPQKVIDLNYTIDINAEPPIPISDIEVKKMLEDICLM